MWTKEIPKEPGFYFFKAEGEAPSILEIDDDENFPVSFLSYIGIFTIKQVENWTVKNFKFWLPKIEFPDNHAK
jgi:hypothetical protein